MNPKSTFDPNAAAPEGAGIFGLPFSYADAKLVYLPINWEATTSYGGGTSAGPQAIFEASHQVDLFDFHVERPYEAGLMMKDISKEIGSWNEEAKTEAQKIIEVGGQIEGNPELKKSLARVNELSAKVNTWVKNQTEKLLSDGKIPGLIGGDHSVPLGAFHAVAKKFGKFGILHFDAHSDTRIAYEGFQYSHASIMHNALEEIPEIQKLVQVGIRDFCEQEWDYCQSQGSRVEIFFDAKMNEWKHSGKSFLEIAKMMIHALPDQVWISFDIDGLDPRFCPHTGTPVPGGLDFNEVVSILEALAKSGKKIIGFDLNEVAPGPESDEWDANVGARLLYKLTGFTLVSQKLAKPRNT
jgi:agmatinase